jgi:hypothetical protein
MADIDFISLPKIEVKFRHLTSFEELRYLTSQSSTPISQVASAGAASTQSGPVKKPLEKQI